MINVRVSPALRTRLAQAAEANGKSLSREIEHRLAYSLSDNDIDRTFNDPETYAFFRLLAVVFDILKVNLGKKWHEHRFVFEEAVARTEQLFLYFEPLGERTIPVDAPMVKDLREMSSPEDVDELLRTEPGKLLTDIVPMAVWALEANLEGAEGDILDRIRPIAAILKTKLIAADMAGVAGDELVQGYVRGAQVLDRHCGDTDTSPEEPK